MFRVLLWAAAVCLFGGAFGSPASAYESAPVATKRTVATFIAEADSVGPGGSARIGLRLRLADGWHTYWRNPGESGVPIELTATFPAGAVAGPLDWPAPSRITEGAIVTYGFTREVVLPMTISPGKDAAGLTGELRANWLVCKDICVPEEAVFAIALPKGDGAPSAEAALFQTHDRAVPRVVPWSAAIASDGTLSVRGTELGPAAVADAWFIPDAPGQIADAVAQTVSIRNGEIVLGLRLAEGFVPGAGLRGVLSLLDKGGARTDVALSAVAGPPPMPPFPLPRALMFAFLGGLILNLMPCVFPILAMKAIAFAAGFARGEARGHALSYTAGVLTTFVGVALALLAARGAGLAAGWGFQFASPVFVAAMAWLLFAVGLNLSGIFRIEAGFAGAGGGLAARGGHVGGFFTGALAVLVATPCTAPFMGVAIAAGLAAPPAVTVLVFLVMGLGLAAPYIALSFVPGLARIMPRPGRWMEVFRQLLAFPMYGAAVWLLWVVSQEAGADGVLATATGFVLLGFAAWSLGQARDGGYRRGGYFGAGVAVCLALAVLAGLGGVPPAQISGPMGGPMGDQGRGAQGNGRGAEGFSVERLAESRAEGRPVFVNLTAAWCVTCLVNARIAIGTDAVKEAFAARRVVYLKGDWTRQDPAIGAFLRVHGRDGVPLYLYYAPGRGEPEVLPQLLTESTILAAVRRGS